MSRFYKTLVSTVLAVFLLVGFLAQVQGADRYWWLQSTDIVTFSLDTQTFGLSKDKTWIYFDTWVRSEYNEKGVQDRINSRKKYNLPTNGYEDLSVTLSHDIYSYSSQNKMMVKRQSYVDYAKDGTVLDSYTFSNPEWKDIIPDSVGEVNLLMIMDYCVKNNLRPKDL